MFDHAVTVVRRSKVYLVSVRDHVFSSVAYVANTHMHAHVTKQGERTAALENGIGQHRYHIGRLEQMMRLLDNGDLSPEAVSVCMCMCMCHNSSVCVPSCGQWCTYKYTGHLSWLSQAVVLYMWSSLSCSEHVSLTRSTHVFMLCCWHQRTCLYACH